MPQQGRLYLYQVATATKLVSFSIFVFICLSFQTSRPVHSRQLTGFYPRLGYPRLHYATKSATFCFIYDWNLCVPDAHRLTLHILVFVGKGSVFLFFKQEKEVHLLHTPTSNIGFTV